MSIWPTDDPAGTHASELADEDTMDDDHAPGCMTLACQGECVDHGTLSVTDPRRQAWEDEQGDAWWASNITDTDYDGPTRPF